jgi:hypothetical protein
MELALRGLKSIHLYVAEYILHMVAPFSAAIDGGTLNA